MSRPTIDPQVWQPPPAPELAGVYAPNDHLSDPELWPVPGTGPEDVAVDPEGRVFTGLADGRILRVGPPGERPRQLANTGGRPLGIEVMPDGRLLVCDAYRGLVAVDPDGRGARPLLRQVGGRDLVLTNNASVASDGTVYFTESTARHPLSEFRADIIEHNGTGSLWRFEPSTGATDRLLTGLSFANGVTLTADGAAVLVAETAGYAIHRVELTGPGQGAAEVLVDNLPGHPDNLSTGPTGTVWCAMPSYRVPQLDALVPRPPLLRKLVWRIPERLQPDAVRTAFVLGFDATGRVTHNLQGDGGRYHYVTGVREHDGWLYLGSLVEASIARVPVPVS